MLFSILIPVFNVEKYINQCVESLDAQTFKDFEVVLVDDGSTDKSGKICDLYMNNHSNVKVIHKENEGLISARRVGITNACGEYCIFCDSDDFLEPDALEQLSLVIKADMPDMIIYNAYSYDGTNKTPFFEHVLKKGKIENKNLIYDKLFLSYSLNGIWLKAVKRDIVDVEYDYTDFYGCNFGEDLLQTVPMIRAAQNIYYLDKCLYNYRVLAGMMHKYNPRYYWSYRKINLHIKNTLIGENIEDFNEKMAFHLIVAAYGATTQYKYAKHIKKEDLDKINMDQEFQLAMQLVLKGRYRKNLNWKQRIILFCLHQHMYFLIEKLLKLKK